MMRDLYIGAVAVIIIRDFPSIPVEPSGITKRSVCEIISEALMKVGVSPLTPARVRHLLDALGISARRIRGSVKP
jgi:hypothetical protein